MKSKGIIILFFSAVIIAFSFVNGKEKINAENSDIILKATQDFTIDSTLFVPTYKDKDRNALAINAKISKNEFAKAYYIFVNTDNKFDLKFTSLTETDGESTYRIFIDHKLLSEFQNPETTIDYVPYVHTINNVMLKKGQKIQIEFNSHTNKKIPERDTFAYSRGRWTTIQLIPTSKKR